MRIIWHILFWRFELRGKKFWHWATFFMQQITFIWSAHQIVLRIFWPYESTGLNASQLQFAIGYHKIAFCTVSWKKRFFNSNICGYCCSQNSCFKSAWRKEVFQMLPVWLKSSQKKTMKSIVETVHKGKKPFKCDICDHSFSQKRFEPTSFHEEKSLSSVTFETTNLHQFFKRKNIPIMWTLWLNMF